MTVRVLAEQECSPEESAYGKLIHEAVHAIVSTLARIVYRGIGPARFAEYERLAGVSGPHPAFRTGISWAIAKLIALAELEQGHEPIRRRRELVRELDAAFAQGRAAGDARKRDRALARCMGISNELATLKTLPRGRRRKEASESFIRSLANVYEQATGRRPYIYTDRPNNPEYSGPFADLLAAVASDARAIVVQLDPDAVAALSASPQRYAKTLKLTTRRQQS